MKKFILPNLPFDAGSYTQKNTQFPLSLDFTMYYDAKNDLTRQETTDETREALKLYYAAGGYGSTPLGEGDYGKRHANQVFRLIQRSLKSKRRRIKGMSFLEIGAGYCYLLYLLKQKGAKSVLALEPGDEGVIGSKKYNIPIIQDFFPSKLLKEKFDYIFSYGVLEHIENPFPFTEEIYGELNPNGMVFIAVPDSEEKFKVGDISIFFHQHINYFTKNSLKNIMTRAGFSEIEIIKSTERSMLAGWGVKKPQAKLKQAKKLSSKDSSDKRIFQAFTENFSKNIKTIQELVNTFEREKKTIGLYAYCCNLKGLLKFKKEPRIFDSDEMKQGKYIVGFLNAFEAPEALTTTPVDVLFITAIDYDREIRESLKKLGLDEKRTRLISLKEIYEKNSGIKYHTSSLHAEK